MAEPSGRDIVERFARAIEEKDFEAQEVLLADDVITDMPQSGERIRGRANAMAVARNYPGGVGTIEPGSSRLVGSEDQWVLTPTFSVLRIEGSGDVYTYAGKVTYSNGETWDIVAIVELRDGKIAKVVTWYAAPFEAPEWRAQWVERMPSGGR
jgi:ketosteroid isomerase-like protein